jgi:hypothetical protein
MAITECLIACLLWAKNLGFHPRVAGKGGGLKNFIGKIIFYPFFMKSRPAVAEQDPPYPLFGPAMLFS